MLRTHWESGRPMFDTGSWCHCGATQTVYKDTGCCIHCKGLRVRHLARNAKYIGARVVFVVEGPVMA